MRALLKNRSVLIGLAATAVIVIIAFAGSLGSFGVRHLDGSPVPYPAARNLMRFTVLPKSVGRVVAGDAAEITDVSPIAEAQSYVPHLLPPPPKGSRGPTQLIRTGSVSIQVKDVGKALSDATLIADEQLGDVIGLSDSTPGSDAEPHTATMAIRVPQYRFAQTLEALGHLGKVTEKSVNAQDVSDQMIDAQARLRNLRRTEADMLSIMDRSGNIDQVLNVTQQISSVREQIERLDAQVQGLQYQVAYSTVNISFISPVVTTTPSGLAVLAKTWSAALASLGAVTVGLLGVLVWLAAFSPYVLLLALVAAFVLRKLRTHAAPTT